MLEALFYDKLDNDQVRCALCRHRCLIDDGATGICGIRQNRKGILYPLVYNKVIHGQVDPIEKKPLYRFLPGTLAYGVSTIGCNFRCEQCHNWEITQPEKGFRITFPEVAPEEIIAAAVKTKCQSIAFTYNEPTINLEFNYEVMKRAHENGLKNVWVSNGYIGEAALRFIAPYLDAINVDLKSFSEKFYNKTCQARLAPVLENLKLIKELDVHLEITTLIIPGLNDSPAELKKIAQFIFKYLGSNTPWHVTRFSPQISWQLKHLPETPTAKIKQAVGIGHAAGLHFVHGGF